MALDNPWLQYATIATNLQEPGKVRGADMGGPRCSL